MIGSILTTLKKFVLICATLAMTQQPVNSTVSLPACQQLCVNNMISNASEFGCSSTDSSCLCSVDDVLNGIRICVIQTCGSDTALDSLSAWEREFCGKSIIYLGAARTTAIVVTKPVSSVVGALSRVESSIRSSSPSRSSLTSSPSSSPSTLGSSSRSSSGLSSNAKIGLAAGIPCGLLAIAVGVGLYLLGKYKARKKSNLLRNPGIPESKNNASLHRYEMDGYEAQLQELETNANRVELPR